MEDDKYKGYRVIKLKPGDGTAHNFDTKKVIDKTVQELLRSSYQKKYPRRKDHKSSKFNSMIEF